VRRRQHYLSKEASQEISQGDASDQEIRRFMKGRSLPDGEKN